MSKIDLAAVWDDAKSMGTANRDLLGAVAGMFILLPAVVVEQLVTRPKALEKDAANEAVLAQFALYAEMNWHLLLTYAVISSFGILTIQSLLLRSERLTVAESMRVALPILPAFVVANLLQALGVMTGMFLFVIPGLYLIGRLALIAPVAAAEQSSNPITILQRSAILTHGNGWRVLGVLSIIFVVTFMIGIAITSVIGVVAELLVPGELADLIITLISSMIETARGVLVALVCAALYRAATQSRAAARGL